HDSDADPNDPLDQVSKDDVAQSEQQRVDQHATQHPVRQLQTQTAALSIGFYPETRGDPIPSRSLRPNPAIKIFQLFFGLRARQESSRDPDNRRESDGDEHNVGKLPRVVAVPFEPQLKIQRTRCGRDHRRDFGPRIYSPPEPTQQQDRARSSSSDKQELPSASDRAEIKSHDKRDDHQRYGHDLRDDYIVTFSAVFDYEP